MEELYEMTTDDGTELELIWFRSDDVLAILYDGLPIYSISKVYSTSRLEDIADCVRRNVRRQLAEDKATVTALIMEVQASGGDPDSTE